MLEGGIEWAGGRSNMELSRKCRRQAPRVWAQRDKPIGGYGLGKPCLKAACFSWKRNALGRRREAPGSAGRCLPAHSSMGGNREELDASRGRRRARGFSLDINVEYRGKRGRSSRKGESPEKSEGRGGFSFLFDEERTGEGGRYSALMRNTRENGGSVLLPP